MSLKGWVALLAMCLLAGCGGARPGPAPVLQRFDVLAPALRQLTESSAALAREQGRLEWAVYGGNVAAVRRDAATGKPDALRFRGLAGRTGNAVRRLAVTARDWRVRTYLTWIANALSQNWYESRAVVLENELLWHDPHVIIPRNYRRLRRADAAARWYAWHAVLWTRAAARLRHRYPGAFRYVPAGTGPRVSH